MSQTLFEVNYRIVGKSLKWLIRSVSFNRIFVPVLLIFPCAYFLRILMIWSYRWSLLASLHVKCFECHCKSVCHYDWWIVTASNDRLTFVRVGNFLVQFQKLLRVLKTIGVREYCIVFWFSSAMWELALDFV